MRVRPAHLRRWLGVPVTRSDRLGRRHKGRTGRHRPGFEDGLQRAWTHLPRARSVHHEETNNGDRREAKSYPEGFESPATDRRDPGGHRQVRTCPTITRHIPREAEGDEAQRRSATVMAEGRWPRPSAGGGGGRWGGGGGGGGGWGGGVGVGGGGVARRGRREERRAKPEGAGVRQW